MNTKFKYDKNTKEATSRVHFYKKTGLIHTYTVESTYFKGMFNLNDEEINEDNLYLIKDFEQTGIDLMKSILDYEELDEDKSLGIAKSSFFNLNVVREYIAQEVIQNEERFQFDF